VKVAREGVVIIATAGVLTVAAILLAIRSTSPAWWVLAVVLSALSLWTVWFFRDPERQGERGPSLVIAPADGKVIMVTDVDEPAFLHGRATRISIFMNIFNVHVNRYPVSGTVKFVHYNRGKFMHAAAEKSSLENEQMSVGIERGTTRVLVRQIAGLLARRVVTYSREGEQVEQGERMGIIRFGSRVDIFLPSPATVSVTPGQLTVAGITVLGTLPEERR
jgi:phosphatidylserine decarboxylase